MYIVQIVCSEGFYVVLNLGSDFTMTTGHTTKETTTVAFGTLVHIENRGMDFHGPEPYFGDILCHMTAGGDKLVYELPGNVIFIFRIFTSSRWTKI